MISTSSDTANTRKQLLSAAELGSADAQCSLGTMYLNLKGEPGFTSFKEALKWFRLAADQGLAAAQYWLGWMNYNGFGVPNDYKEAVKYYLLAGEQGYAQAQYWLGQMYGSGEGVPKDLEEALKWFRLSAEQGNVWAQFCLAVSCSGDEERVKWLRLAAEQGYDMAQDDLGQMYASGKGVPQDFMESYAWFSVAVANGYETAAKGRDEALAKLTPKQLAEGQALSEKYFEIYRSA